MSTSVSFNSNSLQTSSIITSQVNHEDIPVKDAKLFALANANKSNIPFVNYPSRSISIAGTLVASSIANLDAIIDTFKSYFVEKDANLDIGYNGSTRRYIATVNKLSIDRPRGLGYARFAIDFICTEPFGRDTATTSALSAAARTNSSYSDNYTFLGTAPYQLPVFTITYNSITDGDSYVSVTNAGNGQGILITGTTFATNDILEIDCQNRTVKLNGVEINFSGAFPEFPPGAQSINYSDGFTARNFDIDIDYYKMYL